MRDGVIVINKPWKITSFGVVREVKHITGMKKVGHLGTLDPMARGVLPVALGKATRLMDLLDLDLKIYECSARLGISSDTLDIWGKVEDSGPSFDISEEALIEAIRSLSGRVSQTPPMYSARRKNGKRLYEYAREGKYVEAEAKTVYIDADLMYYDTCDFDMMVTCTKGTYIRSFCEDIGRSLGCGACMTGLVRRSTGVFDITNSVNLDEFKSLSREEVDKLIIPIDECIPKFGKVRCGKREANLFANGQSLGKSKWEKLEEPAEETRTFYVPVSESYSRSYRVYGEDDNFLGIGLVDDDLSLKPDKIFL